MPVPEGYTPLGNVGIAYKGDYESEVQYKYMNAVYYEGSTYVALKDSPTCLPADDGENWKFLAKGFKKSHLSNIRAIDTEGLLGEVNGEVDAQALLDKVADKDGDISGKTVAFEIPEEYETPASGNTIKVLFGKITKGLSDLFAAIGVLASLKTVEKSTLVAAINELAEGKFDVTKLVASTNITEPGFAMDGKTASEAITELYSKKVLHYTDYNHGTIEIGTGNYANLMPPGEKNYLFATIITFGNTSSPFSVAGYARNFFVIGVKGNNIPNLQIRYWYTD